MLNFWRSQKGGNVLFTFKVEEEKVYDEVEVVNKPRFATDDQVQYRWYYKDDPYPEHHDELFVVLHRELKLNGWHKEWCYTCQHLSNSYESSKTVIEIWETNLEWPLYG